MTSGDGAAWWRGRRGEWYVAIQAALILLVAFGPRTFRGWPNWEFPAGRVASATAIALLLAGALLMAASAAKLGDRLTPLPRPARHAVLLESGVYRFVRHPMYSGVALAAFGWALVSRGWLTLGYAFLLLVFLDIKAQREEVWLSERFPGYAGYRRRVKKLIPFVY